MQQTHASLSKKDINAKIEECIDDIDKSLYKIRWYRRGFILFWSGLSIGIINFISNYFLNISLLNVIGGIALVIAGFVGFPTLLFILGVFNDASNRYSENFHDEQQNLRKARQHLTKWQQELKQYQEREAIQLPTPAQHAQHLPSLIMQYRKQAEYYRHGFIITQVIIILLSASVTSLSGGWLDKYIVLPWIVPVFSGLISILTSFTLFFRYREKGANLQETGDAMDLEFKACGLKIDPYENLADDKALELLAKRTEALRKDQLQRQQQLEQPSQSEQKGTN